MSGATYGRIVLASNRSAAGTDFDPGTCMLFLQAAAPTGWTKVTDHHDTALRIVSGQGGGAGGSMAFSTVFSSRGISGSVGNTTLAEWQMPYHSHYVWDVYSSAGSVNGYSMTSIGTADWRNIVSPSGGNGAHNHSLSVNALDMRVQYVDAIVARKDEA